MESESKQVMKQVEVLDILKEAVTTCVKNTTFIIFALVTSLPLLILMVHFETLFQQTLVDTARFVNHVLLRLNGGFDGGFDYPWISSCSGMDTLTKRLIVYLEWSAIWNMSIVISVMDGIYGVGALRVSWFLSSGGNGIFVQVGLFFVVNTLKWVSFMIYFCDCKERKLEKKINDVELGKDPQSGS
ncbi:hypothetical protein PIB30_028237 [Stylosanthes scabra]|uniref:Transmembrane protein n=1 Tax=Stylosanthes scabra TaxID=79078 RepID=A0ABU6UAC2_9FABA|nr:hypothetical protein [Stylosanthes scabra]